MPTGRILLKSITESKKMAELGTDSARLLYTWLIPHLDINGCFSGDAEVINARIFTRLKRTPEEIEPLLQDLEKHRLIIRYFNKGDQFLIVPDFPEKQPNLNPTKEGRATIPRPTPEQLQSYSGVTPELLQSKSRVAPDKLQSYSSAAKSEGENNTPLKEGEKHGHLQNTPKNDTKNPSKKTDITNTDANLRENTPQSTPELLRSYSGVTPSLSKVKQSKEKESKGNGEDEKNDEYITFNPQTQKIIISNKKKEYYKINFPKLNIATELRNMELWLTDNPGRKYSSYKQFITNWLKKSEASLPKEDITEDLNIGRGPKATATGIEIIK